MENLVRRLGRIFKEKGKQVQEPEECLRSRMARLDTELDRWMEQGGWRWPCRTLSEAAALLRTDTVTLHHYFTQRMHVDFRTWRTQLRLRDAAFLLLEEPEVSASVIAERVGFTNRSNFSRQFLAYTGFTPGQWREKAWISPDIQAPENDYV